MTTKSVGVSTNGPGANFMGELKTHFLLMVAHGGVLALAGLVTLVLGFATALSGGIVVGLILLVPGLAGIVRGVRAKFQAGRMMTLYAGVALTVGAGVLMVASNPRILTAVIGLALFFDGLCRIAIGRESQPTPTWKILTAGGGLALLCGAFLMAGAGRHPAVLGLLLGVPFILNGLALIWTAITAQRSVPS